MLGGLAVRVAHFKRHLAARALVERQDHVIELVDRLAIDFEDVVSAFEARLLRGRSVHHPADAASDLVLAVSKDHHKYEDREEKVEQRSAQENEKPLPGRRLMKRAFGIFGLELGIAVFAQKLDVAAQRDRRNPPLRLAQLLGPKPGAESDRENLSLDPEKPRENVVTKLVDDDEGSQDDQEADDGEKHGEGLRGVNRIAGHKHT